MRDLRRYAESLVQFAKCLEMEGTNYTTLGNVAIAHRGMGSYDKAEEYYQKTFKAKPESLTYHGGYGHLMYLTQKWTKAEEYINRAIEYSPHNYNYRYYRALLLKNHMKDYKNAEIAFIASVRNRKQTTKYGPHIAECNFEFALLLYEELDKKQESLAYFKLAVEGDIHNTQKYIDQYQIALESVQELKQNNI